MNVVEEGVSNFRDFQGDVRDFITEFRSVQVERTQVEEKRSKKSDRLTALLGLAFTALTVLEGMHISGCVGRDLGDSTAATSYARPRDTSTSLPASVNQHTDRR